MRGLLSSVLIFVFLSGPELGLPPQPDLDLPIVLEHYDPTNPAPGPIPTRPGVDDPRDEPPPLFFGEEIEGETASLIYVLDFSGSMSYAGRAEKVKEEFRRSVRELAPSFRFNVIVYDCTLLLWSSDMRQATPDATSEAAAWVDGRHPNGGGTGTGPAVALALSYKSNRSVALLTDGDPNCPYSAESREEHRALIRNTNTQRAVITVFGVDASGNYRAFCQNVAADSGGTYHDVASAGAGSRGKNAW